MIDFNTYLSNVLKSGYRSSALSPLLWLNALVTVPLYIASFMLSSDFRWAPFIMATAVLVYTLIMYKALIKINPRLVQSEKYQLEMQKLDIVSQKGGPIIFDTVNLPLSSDPKKLTEGTTNEEEGEV